VISRLKVLGFLMQRHLGNPEVGQTRAEHVVWFIENDPENAIVGSPFCQVFKSDPAYERVRNIWDRVVDKPDAKTGVILNAAHFFSLEDPERSRALLERGERLSPLSPDWAEQLGQDLLRKVSVARAAEDRGGLGKESPQELKEAAIKALVHFERALAAANSTTRRFQILPSCAQAALESGRWAEAVRYSDEVIAIAPKCPDERHRPDFVHWAHITRGRASLEAGDLDSAARELLEAGKQGSAMAPVLRSFGPDFRLARLLLERGKVDPILSYLDRCSTFWKPDRIAKWRKKIEQGERPHMFTGFDPGERSTEEG
jgi:tetratricopeptide (TPR) repeat protein